MSGFEEHCAGAWPKFPPGYKAIKEKLLKAGAETAEQAWTALHAELICLDLWGASHSTGAQREGPARVAAELVAALGASDLNKPVYQHLLEATDRQDRDALKAAVNAGQVYPPARMEPHQVKLEALGNFILGRFTDYDLEIGSGQSPTDVATKALLRALQCLPGQLAATAVDLPAFATLATQLERSHRQTGERAELVPRKRGGAIAVAALLVVCALGVGATWWLASSDGRTGGELLQAARASYRSGDYQAAVELGESALARMKARGSSPSQIHDVRKFLGSAYYKAGHLDAAIEQYQILTKAYPSDAEYKATLSQLEATRAEESK